jgi:hypothetical protein
VELNGGECPASSYGYLTSRVKSTSILCTGDEMVLEPVWMLWRKKKSLYPAGNETMIFRPPNPQFVNIPPA